MPVPRGARNKDETMPSAVKQSLAIVRTRRIDSAMLPVRGAIAAAVVALVLSFRLRPLG